MPLTPWSSARKKEHPDALTDIYEFPVGDTEPADQPVSVDEPPNGGIWAWLQVLVGFFMTFNSWGLINSFGVFQNFYGTHGMLEGESAARISWIGALSGAMTFAGSSIFGFLVDAGYSRELALASTVTGSFSLMMLSLSTKYYQVMLTEGLLTGISGSIMFLVGIAVISPYFSTRRAIAIGIGATGSSVGGVVYAAATRKLLSQVGFPWTTRILGFILLGTGLFASSVIRIRVPPRKRGGVIAFECFRELPYMAWTLGMMMAFIGFYTFYFYYQEFALSLNPNNQVYLYMSAIVNAGAVMGRVIPSYAADRIGPFNVLIPSCLMSAVLAFGWMGVHNEAGVIILGLIFGFVSGPITALPGTVAAKLTPNLNRLGVRLSLSLVFCGVGLVVGAPFAGMMIRDHGFFWAKLYCALAWIGAAVCMVISHQAQAKGKIFANI